MPNIFFVASIFFYLSENLDHIVLDCLARAAGQQTRHRRYACGSASVSMTGINAAGRLRGDHLRHY
jgi:hypothetical protein